MTWWPPFLAVVSVVVGRAASRRWSRRVVVDRFRGASRNTSRSWTPRWFDGWIERWPARRAPVGDDVAPTLDALARATAAGTTLATAIAALDRTPSTRPFAAAVARASDHHALGVPLAEAIVRAEAELAARDRTGWQPGRRLARARPMRPGAMAVPEVSLGFTALELAARHGGTIAANLDRTAAAVRERRAVAAERAVHSAQARLSALVLSVLPLAFAAWTVSTDARVGRFLFTTAPGWVCLAAGITTNVAGWLWMRHIVRGRP